MTKPEIREPLLHEAAALGAASYAAWLKGVSPYVSAASHDAISELDFADFIRANPEQILAAFIGDRAIGYIATEHGDNYISDLWVDPDFEGRGIGTALLEAMAARLRDQGFETATIEVLTENTRALSLYRHLGFVTTWQGVREDGYLREKLEKTGLMKVLTLSEAK